MPLPFIVAGVWAGAAYLAHKSQKEVQESIEYCNHVWDQVEQVSSESKQLAEYTYNELCNSAERLDDLRQDVYYGTLNDFVSNFNQIRNKPVELAGLDYLPAILNNTQVTTYNAKDHEIHRSDAFASPLLAGGVAVAFGAIGGGIMFAQGKMKKAQVEGQIDEAETTLAKVKAEAEQVQNKCSEMEYSKSRLDLYYRTFSQLQKLVERTTGQLQYIIQTEGSDYRFYSQEVREQLMTMGNFAKVLRDFSKEDIIDYEGNILRSSEIKFDECRNLLKMEGYDVDEEESDGECLYVGLVNTLDRYWLTYDKSTKVRGVPQEYFNYAWLVTGVCGNKLQLFYDGISIVVMIEDVFTLSADDICQEEKVIVGISSSARQYWSVQTCECYDIPSGFYEWDWEVEQEIDNGYLIISSHGMSIYIKPEDVYRR